MSKTVVEFVDPKILHNDPDQPRQPDWDSDEVQEELQKLADSYDGDPENQIWQIKIDENNTVRLGERRWRAALKVNLSAVKVEKIEGLSELEWFKLQTEDDEYKVLHSELDKAWAYGLRVVQINQNDNDISLKQLKEMDQTYILNLMDKSSPGQGQEGGIAQLVRSLEPNPKKQSGRQRTVGDYIKVLYLEKETRAMIGRRNGSIPYTYAREVTKLYPDHLNEKSKVEQMLRDGKFNTRDQLNTYIDTYFEELKKQAEVREKELEEEEKQPEHIPEPDKKPKKKSEPEEELPTPEPDKKVVENEAQKLKREKDEAKDKMLKNLYVDYGKGNSLAGKIKSAEEMELDEELISGWKDKYTELDKRATEEDLNTKEYNDLYDSIRVVVKEIDNSKKERKQELDRQKIEDSERERLREEVKEELMEDEDFKEEVVKEQTQANFEEGGQVIRAPVNIPLSMKLTPEELKDINEYYEHSQAILSRFDVKQRGALFSNWWNHASILGIVEMLRCPDCDSPSGNLVWKCHDHEISFYDAVEIARGKYEKSLVDK